MISTILNSILYFMLMYYLWSIIMILITASQSVTKINSMSKFYPKITKSVNPNKMFSVFIRFIVKLFKHFK